jgi:hypothetical protein
MSEILTTTCPDCSGSCHILVCGYSRDLMSGLLSYDPQYNDTVPCERCSATGEISEAPRRFRFPDPVVSKQVDAAFDAWVNP